MNPKLLSAIGLARKAGAAAFGTPAVREAMRKNRAKAVLVALDASERTKKQLETGAAYYRAELIRAPFTMRELSEAAGLVRLSSAVAVTDPNLWLLIKKTLLEINSER